MQKRKLENKESDEEEIQENAVILQQEVSIRVSQEKNSQTSAKSPIRKNEEEDQVKDIEQEDIEMNGKESRQGSAIEEKERQKRRKQETEEEIDIVGMPIEESIWAPSKRECNQNSSLLANIPAYNVPGSTEEERIKFIEWSLKNNEHVKEVREVFKRGNLWIEVSFDCNYGRSEAIQKISRKESDWYRMILEEEGKDKKEKQRKHDERYHKEKSDILKAKETNYRERENRIEMKENRYNTDKDFETENYLTIWDLPADINKKELEYICRRMKKAQIVRIKRSKYKALAIVQVEETNEKDIPWAIPVANNKLVRVTKGVEDHKARETQKKYTAKLTDLLRNVSEVLLLRCLRSKGARSVYIPSNRNGNQKKTAMIMFATEEDMEAAQSKPIMYNNF